MSDLGDAYCHAQSNPLNTYDLAKEIVNSMQQAVWWVVLFAINEKREEFSGSMVIGRIVLREGFFVLRIAEKEERRGSSLWGQSGTSKSVSKSVSVYYEEEGGGVDLGERGVGIGR